MNVAVQTTDRLWWVMADFGETDFGQPFWRPTLAKPTSAQTDFGLNRLWPKRV